jgi:ferritin-like protein
MGTVGNSLISGIDPREIVEGLDALYAFEMSVVCWTMAVRPQLTGAALVFLTDEFGEVQAESLKHAAALADRAAHLGGGVTGDPTEFISRSPLDGFALPEPLSDPAAIVSYALAQVQRVIRSYGALTAAVAGKDEVTHRLLVGILCDHVAREDALEGVLQGVPVPASAVVR